MTTNVQTSFENVHGRTHLALVSCHRQRRDLPVGQIGRWETRRLPWWTLVWSGALGYQARVVDAAGRERTVDRLPRSWAVHAPDSAFAERIPAPRSDHELLFLFLSISGALPPLSSRRLTVVLDHDDRLAGLVRTMHAAQERNAPGDALAAHGLLLALIGEILVCANDGGDGSDATPWRLRAPGSAATAPGLLAAVDERVGRSLAAPPSRAGLAAALGISESSLAHRFRAETGMSLLERIRWLRIREAKLRLAEPAATVKSVALSLGFANPAYFSQVFKAIAGTTPEDYQRRCR